MSRMLLVSVMSLVMCGCISHQRIEHGEYLIEVTDRVSWWGANITATSTCEKTRVDADGHCLSAFSVGPAIAQAPGIGLPILSSLTGTGALLGSAVLIRDGLARIPASTTSINAGASAVSGSSSATSPVTVNIRGTHWGHH